MLSLKDTFIFLNKNPSLEELSSIIKPSSDTEKYLDLLSKELNLKKRKITRFLKKIAQSEKNLLEKAFLEISAKKRHICSSFLERLFLSLKYGSIFTKYLSKFKRYKDKNEILINYFYLIKIKKSEKKNEKKIVKILKKSENLKEILPFFKDVISDEAYCKFIRNSDIESLGNFISKLEGDTFYTLLAKKIYKFKIQDTILLINSIPSLDNVTLYKYLLNIYFTKKGSFSKFKKYFGIIWVDDFSKLKILFCWLRIFIKNKQFEKFIMLYKYLEEVEKEEMVVYKTFYECVKQYKMCNKLRFGRFNQVCGSFEDDNPFGCVKLETLGEEFNFDEK